MSFGFITRYTTALYSAPEQSRPRYEEFRDMFSEGQLKSKIWLTEELSKIINVSNQSVVIAGSWFATLAFLLLENPKNRNLKITCVDIDKRCEEFITHLKKVNENVTAITNDMFEYPYSEDIVINTSCEHISNLNDWLSKIASGTTVVLQSNNLTSAPTHINCANSIGEFKNQAASQLSRILYEGENNLNVYTRYMLIGIKR